jgi:hypothetical protein
LERLGTIGCKSSQRLGSLQHAGAGTRRFSSLAAPGVLTTYRLLQLADWLLKQRGQWVVLGVVVANRSGDRAVTIGDATTIAIPALKSSTALRYNACRSGFRANSAFGSRPARSVPCTDIQKDSSGKDQSNHNARACGDQNYVLA